MIAALVAAAVLAFAPLNVSPDGAFHDTDGKVLWYGTVEAAAKAALAEAATCEQGRHECGGVIYRTGRGYMYTAPITSHFTNGIDLWPAYEPHQNDVVADYHTHPCVGNKPLNNFFSPGDVAVMKGFNIAGYMLSLCDGYVRRWAPGDDIEDEEIDFHSGRKMYLTRGHIVGTVRE